MVGHSITRAPRFSNRFLRSADWVAARVVTIVLPLRAILGDLSENFSGSHCKHLFSQRETQFLRALHWTTHFVSNHASAIETGNETFDGQLRSLYAGFSCDWYLAASTERPQKASLSRDSRARCRVIQNLKQAAG